MINQFYVHFRLPPNPEQVSEAVLSLDPNAGVIPMFNSGFFCAVDTSPSKFRFALEQAFPSGGYLSLVVKNNSLTHLPGSDLPES